MRLTEDTAKWSITNIALTKHYGTH